MDPAKQCQNREDGDNLRLGQQKHKTLEKTGASHIFYEKDNPPHNHSVLMPRCWGPAQNQSGRQAREIARGLTLIITQTRFER